MQSEELVEWKVKRFFSKGDELDLDVHEMFVFYNEYFFQEVLDKCQVRWSTRMTMCAGTCAHSGPQFCTISLSEPLLKFRTADELKETLLHEMIHAFLFLTNPKCCLVEQGHGKEFKELMHNINHITGLKITVFHSFHDEVNFYRKHVWRCNGRCKEDKPFYGYVRRAVNRPPQKADPWFRDHQRKCGGEFVKISSGESTDGGSQDKQQPKRRNSKSKKDKGFIPFSGKATALDKYFKKDSMKKSQSTEKFVAFSGEGILLGSNSVGGGFKEENREEQREQE